MSRRLAFDIPDAPVAKARARVTFKNGKPHAYTPSKTAAAEERIQLWAMRAIEDAIGKRATLPMFTGPLALIVRVFLRPPKSIPKRMIGQARPAVRPDIDNYQKLVFDGLSRAGVWRDDAQIVDCQISKRYVWDRPPYWDIVIEDSA